MKAKLYLFLFCSTYAFSQKTIGGVEKLHPQLEEIVSSEAKIEVLAEGFSWSEGPVWVPELNAVLFTDVPENKLYQWDEQKGLQIYLDPSGYTGYAPNEKKTGGNGLILDPQGNLLIAQHGDRRIAKVNAPLSDPKGFETVIDTYQGNRFHSPNDLILSASGDLYFTDPPYGLSGDNDPLREMDVNGVYRKSVDGSVSLLINSLSRPNGLALSPDESVLYVANSDPKKNLWMAYDMVNGELKNERVFFDATSMTRPGYADGMKIHSKGYVFATGPGGVLVFSPEGTHLGTILTESRTANCTFNEDESALYMTSHGFLTRIKLKK